MKPLVIFLMCLAISGWAQNNTDKINNLIDNGQYQQAIDEIDLINQQANDFNLGIKKAQLLITLGDFASAEKILTNLLSEPLPDFNKAIAISTKGFMLLNRGNFDACLENLQRAQQLFQQAGKENSAETAQCLSYMGQLYLATGKTKQAEDYQLIALQIRQKIFPAESAEVAGSYNDLGLAYSLTDADKAIQYYEMALPIYKKLFGETHAKVAVACTNIGAMYNKLELYGDAQNNFETALSIWKKLYPQGHPNQALVLMSLGYTYSKLRNTKATKAYYRLALSQYQKAYGQKHPDLASAYNQMGGLSLAESKYDSALYYYQQALLANSVNFNFNKTIYNPKANSAYNGTVMLYTLRAKAQALEEKYLNKTIKKSDLTLALTCLQVSDTLIDFLRQNSKDESDKIALGALANEVYEDGVRVAQLLSDVTAQPGFYRAIAFYFAEKSKSAVLLESIADANAKSFAGIPVETLEKEKTLKADIALYTQKLAQKPEPSQESVIRKKLFDLNAEYESFIKSLEKDYPEYFNLKFNVASPSIESLQAMLPDGTALISYFMAEHGNQVYIFTLTNKKFKSESRQLPAKFDRQVKGFTNSLFYSDPSTYQQTGTALSKLLLPNVGGSIKDLVIIPSGRLATIPFEALPMGKGLDQDSFGKQFWINRFSIGYQFSSTLLTQQSKKVPVSQSSILLCAPIQFSKEQNLGALPGTEAEVNFIANLFGESASLKKADDATETAIKQTSLKDYKYLHFATHGVVDEQAPELSRIFLKETNSDDGNLFAGEIYNLNLNADMVALSACQTGLGKVSKGEGVIGLSRALVYAGARNIMVSYWSVSDESTAQLMSGFYKNILQIRQPEYRKSLQQVKIKMIAENKYSAPFYWAPFVIVGF